MKLQITFSAWLKLGEQIADKRILRIIGITLRTGWNNTNCKVIVINPELENWIWQRNDHVAIALGLSSFAAVGDRWPEGELKPARPKETLEAVLKTNRIPRSSSIYKNITSRVSYWGR